MSAVLHLSPRGTCTNETDSNLAMGFAFDRLPPSIYTKARIKPSIILALRAEEAVP